MVIDVIEYDEDYYDIPNYLYSSTNYDEQHFEVVETCKIHRSCFNNLSTSAQHEIFGNRYEVHGYFKIDFHNVYQYECALPFEKNEKCCWCKRLLIQEKFFTNCAVCGLYGFDTVDVGIGDLNI